MIAEEHKEKILSGVRSCSRGGLVIDKVIERAKNNSRLVTGEDVLLVMNTYNVPLPALPLLFISHGLSFEEHRFLELLGEQVSRKTRQCVAL